MTIDDLVPDVLGRVEEYVPPDGPIFWKLVDEVYPQIAYGMFEAALITGTVQLSAVPIDLAANTTYFDVPKGTFGPLRMKAPYAIRKVTLKGLDDMIPKWQKAAPGQQIQAWFPLGVSKYGIYPQLATEATVTMDFLVSPVNHVRPLPGTTVLPFQPEFTDGFSQYAAAMLRSKEGGAEAEEAAVVYSEYMSQMKALSAFQGRLDSLVLTGDYGGKGQVNPRKLV